MARTAKRPLAPALAMHSAENPAWCTPMILRRFAQVLLRPAAKTSASIDLDYASDAYAQAWWPDNDRPHAYLDGSKGRDVLVEADRRSTASQIGAGFLNPPGLGGGDMVQQCWKIFEHDHREEKLDSGFFVGFSVEQFGSLQNVGERNPLTAEAADLITTIVPSRRAHYVVHPKQLITITKKKQKKRDRKSKQWVAEQKLLKRLRDRTDDRPVDAGAPSHLSYVAILWAHDRTVRREQMEKVCQFLEEQRENPKSLLHKFEAIGPLELGVRR